jgi:hypothetical protein
VPVIDVAPKTVRDGRVRAFAVIAFPESEPESTVAGHRREVWKARSSGSPQTGACTVRAHDCGVTVEIRARVKGRIDVPKDAYLTFEHTELVGETFSGRKLDQMRMSASSFTGCEFTGMRIGNWVTGAGRTAATTYIECVFDRSRIRFNPGGLARFERCSFRDVDLRDWMCLETELVDCVFTGRLRRSFFNGTVPEELVEALGRTTNEFRGNDFSGMGLIDVDFRTGIDLSLQRVPTGEQYVYLTDAERSLQRAREQVVASGRVRLGGEHGDVVPVIDVALKNVRNGQRQLLLRKDTYRRIPQVELDTIFDILKAVA